MDARKHLRGLGWKGEGHAIGKNSNGLTKPLLITHKYNNHGLGAKSQKEKQADQWWLNAFDNALKDIGTGRESSLYKIKENSGSNGLYRFFVRGPGLEGTFDNSGGDSTGTSTPTEGQTLENSTVTMSVADLQNSHKMSGSDKKTLKKERKEKKEKKGKKRKRDTEDPVDSHQEEPESGRPNAVLADDDDEPAKDGTAKKRKKKHRKQDRQENEGDERPLEAVRNQDRSTEGAPESESIDSKRAEKRRAKEEKRARKEERRRRKEQASSQAG
ncbi:uncharacterized protein PV09_00903 [Verruconis gallopava]|uniref:G-patch domain-containing protein n=1 Tax=Verruconis gallopava TaxID=253628 RepID=A0A0D1Y1V4_9PEZI|nr:uncharacterized protein PV09_00903 [Verruconis gallopava]KIW09006.1 hypothetical protein PV09_00903 [Verruconis gallopava]